MKPIATSTIEKVRRRMNKLTGRSGVELARRLMEEQTSVAAYLTGVDEDILNEDERAHLFYLGLVIWQVMKEFGPLPEVDFETLQEAEAANIAAMERATESPNADERDVVFEMLGDYGQPDLLGAMVMAMTQPRKRGEDDLVVREEIAGAMFLDLKTVIDVWNA